MNVHNKIVAYPIAMAVALAIGNAHAQTTTPATLAAQGQTIATGVLGDVYSKQGHTARNSLQRLPTFTVTLADDYAVGDEILLAITGTGVTPNIDRGATTTDLDKAGSINCSATGGNFVIGHPDQYIEQAAPYQTLRLRVTQKDQTVTTTTGATCRIEGIWVTDVSLGNAALTERAFGSSDEATISASWTAYDGAYVIGGAGPPTNNNIIDQLAAPRAIAKVRNQFGPYQITKQWDGVIDVQVAGSQYTRFMANSPPNASAVAYSATDVLTFTAVDRGSGPVGTTTAANTYAPAAVSQTNYFDGAVAIARFELNIAGDFGFVREGSPLEACTVSGITAGGTSSVAGVAVQSTAGEPNGAGTEATAVNSTCSQLTYTYTRTAAQSDGTATATTMKHTLTATRGNSVSPWFVRQDYADTTRADWVVTGFASVGSKSADPLSDTDTNLDTTVETGSASATYSAGTGDPGAWTINGTRVFVPYMPFDTGITRILRVSNIMFTDGDRDGANVSIFDTADAVNNALPLGVGKSNTDSRVGRTAWSAAGTEDGATVLYQVWNADGQTCTFDGTTLAKANATTSLANDFRTGVVGCSNILTGGAGTVSAMITIGAPEQGIEVVSAYNVNGDRVQVINNSNGRNNSESNAELGSRRPSGRSDYKQSEDNDDNLGGN